MREPTARAGAQVNAYRFGRRHLGDVASRDAYVAIYNLDRRFVSSDIHAAHRSNLQRERLVVLAYGIGCDRNLHPLRTFVRRRPTHRTRLRRIVINGYRRAVLRRVVARKRLRTHPRERELRKHAPLLLKALRNVHRNAAECIYIDITCFHEAKVTVSAARLHVDDRALTAVHERAEVGVAADGIVHRLGERAVRACIECSAVLHDDAGVLRKLHDGVRIDCEGHATGNRHPVAHDVDRVARPRRVGGEAPAFHREIRVVLNGDFGGCSARGKCLPAVFFRRGVPWRAGRTIRRGAHNDATRPASAERCALVKSYTRRRRGRIFKAIEHCVRDILRVRKVSHQNQCRLSQ